jgi:Na+/proline symporter
VAWGVVLVGIAVAARDWGSVFTAGLSIASLVYGPMLGAFLLGVLTRRTTETGVIAGMAASLAMMLAVRVWTPLAWTWYVLLGTGLCVAVGMAVSVVADRGRASGVGGRPGC